MITTAEGYKPQGGKQYRSRFVTLGDFEGFWAVEEDASPDSRRRRFQALLAYGVNNCLTGRQQEVVDAYYYQGKNIEAIAEELAVASSTVCRHLQAARKRLAELAAQAEDLRRLPS